MAKAVAQAAVPAGGGCGGVDKPRDSPYTRAYPATRGSPL